MGTTATVKKVKLPVHNTAKAKARPLRVKVVVDEEEVIPLDADVQKIIARGFEALRKHC